MLRRRLNKFIYHHRFCTDQVVDYLRDKVGLKSPTLVNGVIDSFKSSLGRTPSLRDLDKFGTTGLKALADSILRENKHNENMKEKVDVTVNFTTSRGSQHNFTLIGKESETIQNLAERSKELGSLLECACKGIAACSTCHIIVVDKEYFNRLVPPDETELDMLDLAYGVTDTSRLGCQLKLSKECDNILIRIPDGVHNLFS